MNSAVSVSQPLTHTIHIGKAFGLDSDYEYTTSVPESQLQAFVPPLKNHKFTKPFVRDILEFLDDPWGDALKVVGPTGSGKSSGVAQTLARLNKPMLEITATGSFEFLDLVGGFQLTQREGATQPEMQFIPGPLTMAMKMGVVLLINEYDYAPPDEMAGLNDIIQGAPLFIQATGEIVHPHPDFRLIVTGNTNGTGDASRLMLGTQRQNLAANDRYRTTFVDYLDEQDEIELLTSEFLALSPDHASYMVKVANSIRDRFINEDMNAPLSTRALLRWAHLISRFGKIKNAFDAAFMRSLNDRDREAADKIAQGIFGGLLWQ